MVVSAWFRTALLLLLVVATSGQYCLAQFLVNGQVVDAASGEPLPFANVFLDEDTRLGVVADIDGAFSFRSESKPLKLTCSFVGYDTYSLSLVSLEVTEDLVIPLSPSSLQLAQAVVTGENPAHRIIRKVISNKDLNNPEKVASFKYTTYNKMVYDLEEPPEEFQSQDEEDPLEAGSLGIMESVSERTFIAPDRSNETILGTKVSGFKNPNFAAIATDFQPFSFYKDIIPLLDINYVNPIARGSLKKYDFTLEETLHQLQDTVYIISYRPREKSNIDGLTGLLYVNSRQFAIQNVIAEPFEKGPVDMRIEQKYQWVDDSQWFPEQLNFVVWFGEYTAGNPMIRINGRGYIEDIELFAAIDKSDMDLESIRYHEMASKRDTSFWEGYRRESLTAEEIETYALVDSIGEKYHFDQLLKIAEKASRQKFPIRFLDVDLPKTVVFNEYEGYRLGLGLTTNERISECFELGGFAGYGLRDKEWKYGGELTLNLNEDKEFQIRGRHQNNLRETGTTTAYSSASAPRGFRNLLASQMDRIQENSVSVGVRALKYLKLDASFQNTVTSPQYAYTFLGDAGEPVSGYVNSEVTVNARFAFKEKFIRSLGRRLSMGSKYPILKVGYSRGLEGVSGGQFDYHKLTASLSYSFVRKYLGTTRIRLEGGIIDRPLPIGLLFTGDGAFAKGWPVVLPNFFQTARPYEFLSDRYANLFLSHNFGSLLFQAGKFKPQISVHQNIGVGSLTDPARHDGVAFETRDKGLFETGLILDNLVRMNYLNMAYIGFGVGGFYRYGAYGSGNSDDFAVKLSVTFQTK